jgi:hypothetical protein
MMSTGTHNYGRYPSCHHKQIGVFAGGAHLCPSAGQMEPSPIEIDHLSRTGEVQLSLEGRAFTGSCIGNQHEGTPCCLAVHRITVTAVAS